MTFISNSTKEVTQLSDLYVIIKDIKVLSGVFPRGTILKVTGSSGTRGDNFIDCAGNILRETALCAESIIPLTEAYKLFKALGR